MKKYEYITPLLKIDCFDRENIITVSAAADTEYLPGIDGYQVKAQVSFDDLIEFNAQ